MRKTPKSGYNHSGVERDTARRPTPSCGFPEPLPVAASYQARLYSARCGFERPGRFPILTLRARRRGLLSVSGAQPRLGRRVLLRLSQGCFFLGGGEMCCEKWSHVAEMFLFIEGLEEDYKILCLCTRAFVE